MFTSLFASVVANGRFLERVRNLEPGTVREPLRVLLKAADKTAATTT